MIDSSLHRAFPGVCEVIVDGQIRSFHNDWQYISPYPNPWRIFYRSLAQYFITEPYPFTVEPYRLAVSTPFLEYIMSSNNVLHAFY